MACDPTLVSSHQSPFNVEAVFREDRGITSVMRSCAATGNSIMSAATKAALRVGKVIFIGLGHSGETDQALARRRTHASKPPPKASSANEDGSGTVRMNILGSSLTR